MATKRFSRWVAAGLLVFLAKTACPAVVLPINTDFEIADGYSLGPVTGGDEWTFSTSLTAAVVEGGFSGDQALSLTGSGWFVFLPDTTPSPSSSVTWVDFYMKPVFADIEFLPTSISESLAAVTGFVKVASTGEVYVVDGDGLGGGDWTSSGFVTLLDGNRSDDWLRISYRLDYAGKRWDLFLNGDLILSDLGFLNNTASSSAQIRLQNDPSAGSLLDYFYAGSENPLFADSGTGIPNTWFTSHGLSPDRYGDPDKDGVNNLTEFFLGLSPNNPDTDGDGVFDRREILRGSDPAVAETHSLGTVPFSDGFESDAPGAFISGTRLWDVQKGAGALVEVRADADAPEGEQSLALAGSNITLERQFADATRASVVWLDFQIKGTPRAEPPANVPGDVAAVFYFTAEGNIMALDGGGNGGGIWSSAGSVQPGWNRVSLRLDYGAQRWGLWLNGVRIFANQGFANPVPYFSGFALQHNHMNTAGLDGFQVRHEEPADLDNDADGLSNAQEAVLGTNPDNRDTDGDGIHDAVEVQLGLNPAVAETFVARLVDEGSGAFAWRTSFAASEGYAVGNLNGQLGWLGAGATVSAGEQADISVHSGQTGDIERYLGADGLDQVWITFRARLKAGVLPQVDQLSGPAAALFGFRRENYLSVYDSEKSKWMDYPVASGASEWNDYLLYIDYRAQRWLLAYNGRLIAQDLPFRDSGLTTITRFRMLQMSNAGSDEAHEASFDDLVVTNKEPVGLDFDGDGLTNAEEIGLGTDPLNPDTDSDGIPDGWEVAHGLNPKNASDALLDNDNDGLIAFEEFVLGTDPETADGEVPGGVMVERWTGISGGSVSHLTGHAKFYGAPDSRFLVTSLEAAPSALNSFGSRVRGYLLPNVTGEYTFWVAGDDAVEFWLSTTDRPFERRRVAYSTSATGEGAFSDGVRQSAPISLVAGQRYYFEVLHKDNTGTDHFSVAWQPPGGSRVVIPGAHLARFLTRADDLDGDGLPDAWEVDVGLDPAVPNNVYLDADGDGLNTLAEFQAGTHPGLADTDGDGMPDNWELTRGFDPLDADDGAADPDGDGLSNAQEYIAGTNPAKPDTDGDGLPDGWEVSHGLNPLLASDAGADPDGDRLTNYVEYLLGSDPQEPDTDVPGKVLVEEWREVYGVGVADFTNNSKFSNAPGALAVITSLEMPHVGREHYGRRVRGYVTAPVSGDYTFFVAGDNRVDFYLSTDDTPFLTRRIGIVGGPTSFRHYPSAGERVSPPVPLLAGQRYYFEVLHKNVNGVGHFSIGWRIPGGAPALITGEHLSAFIPRADDADGDGLPDAWEAAKGLNPSVRHGVHGAYGDLDADGVPNLYEYQAGTNPASANTDGDDYPDALELVAGHAADEPEDFPEELSSPWSMSLIGSLPGTPRVVRTAEGGYLVQSRGLGIHNLAKSDWFPFASRPVDGDFEFTARVRLHDLLRDGSAAIALRSGVASGSSFVALTLTGGKDYVLQFRPADGQLATIRSQQSLPENHDTHYLRLTRRGVSVRAEHSLDGVQWRSLGELTFAAADARIGFTAWNDSTHPAARLFDEITLRVDTDGDGLYDDEEALLGTSPELADTDGDGLSDYEERQLGLDPLVANPPVVTLATHTGSSGTVSLGSWRVDGDARESTTVRAALDFEINLAAPGVYRLEVETQSASNSTADPVFPVEVWIDGHFIARVNLLLPAGELGFARVITPWLTSGTHTVRLVYDNTLSYRSLRINALRVQVIGGPDTDSNGRPDWIDARLAADNVLTVAPEYSLVSPASVEGVSRFFGLFALVADGQPVAATRSPGLGWFADVPLSPGAAVTLGVSFENGAVTEERQLVWKPLNLLDVDPAALTEGRLRIRLDDTLLITATTGEAQVNPAENPLDAHTTLVFQRAGQSDETIVLDNPANAPLARTFVQPGIYTVTATHVSTQGSGSTTTANLEIEVVAAAFSGDVAAGVGVSRIWDNPLLPKDVAVEFDQGVELDDLPATVGSSFRLLMHNPGVSRVVARLHPGGPILDQAELTGVRVSSNDQTAVDLLQVYPDGSRLIGTPIMISDITSDTRIEVEIFVQGVTFEDGTTLKVFAASDFDAFGRVYVRFILPAGVDTSFCHRIHLYRGDTYLGMF